MPSVNINSASITSFGFSLNVDVYNRTFTFSLLPFTVGPNLANRPVSFSVIDQDGVILSSINFTTPQIANAATTTTWVLDLSSVNFAFLFQTYAIYAAIQDTGGQIYQTNAIYPNICQPTDLTDSGYVPGIFSITPDCINSVLTVKEITALVYNNLAPFGIPTKTGILSYPTGTIAAVNFSNTPFSNNVVYTGQYNITCTTVASYAIGGDVYILVSYITNNVFPVSCANKMPDIVCCITKVQQTAIKNCNNAIGENAKHQLSDISLYVMNGMLKEISGQDAQFEVDYIRKYLSCDCGSTSLSQSEFTPINPAVTSIVLHGVGGTSVPPPTTTGNTQTYNIASNVYQIVKGNTGDLAFTIQIDTSVSNTVKYIITFNYDTMAGYILTAIGADPTLLAQLNSLIQATGVNLQGLNGGCVIDLTKTNYSLSQAITGSTLVTNIVINGNNYAAPTNTFANNPTAVAAWLNGLTLGVFSATVTSGILTILSVNNTNAVSTLSFTSPNVTQIFQGTNATLVQVLQAIINYLCSLTDLQIALNNAITVCTLDYNNNIVTTLYPVGTKQRDYNIATANAICNLCARINSLTALTCAKIQALFSVNNNAVFANGTDWYMSVVGGNCTQLSGRQQAMAFIAAVNAYSDVKTAFCAIDCSVPGTCPDVANINLAMSGANIGVYGLTWVLPMPVASQTVTVRYRVHGTTTWLVSTNSLIILPNGNISGSSPYLIPAVATGTTYDVWINNNCGGAGFIGQITTPTGTVYSGSFRVNNVLYSICASSPVTLYSSSPFASGVTMFSDSGLSIPETGFLYIVPSTGEIFQLNSGTGVVGSDTGLSCSSGTPASYILGNSTGSICAGSPVTLYTNGAFSVGGILYTDPALTTPRTGFSYVVQSSTGIIYNLNSSTGAIGASTGLSCSGVVNIFNDDLSIGQILSVGGIAISSLAPPFPVNASESASGTHTAYTGSISVTYSNVPAASHLQISVNGVIQFCTNTLTGGTHTYNAPGIPYASTDLIEIRMGPGAC